MQMLLPYLHFGQVEDDPELPEVTAEELAQSTDADEDIEPEEFGPDLIEILGFNPKELWQDSKQIRAVMLNNYKFDSALVPIGHQPLRGLVTKINQKNQLLKWFGHQPLLVTNLKNIHAYGEGYFGQGYIFLT